MTTRPIRAGLALAAQRHVAMALRHLGLWIPLEEWPDWLDNNTIPLLADLGVIPCVVESGELLLERETLGALESAVRLTFASLN